MDFAELDGDGITRPNCGRLPCAPNQRNRTLPRHDVVELSDPPIGKWTDGGSRRQNNMVNESPGCLKDFRAQCSSILRGALPSVKRVHRT